MATILKDAAYMALPMNIKRGNPIPLDTTAVWYSKTELDTYAKSGATAYVGQILTLYADNKCEAYMISNTAGDLIKLVQTAATGDLASDVATLQTNVNDLIAKVGKAAEGEAEATGLFKDIADIQAILGADVNSGLRKDVADNKSAISTLQGADTTKSVRDIAVEEVAKVVDGADDAFDTLKEIADWISTHGEDAADLTTTVNKLEGILAGIGGTGEKATVVAYVTDAIDALKIGDYAKAADLTALAARVKTVEDNYVSNSTYDTKVTALEATDKTNADNIAAVKKIADAAVPKSSSTKAGSGYKVTFDANGLVTGATSALTADEMPNGIAQSKIDGLSDSLDAKQDNLTFNTAYDATSNKAATMSDINTAKKEVVGTTTDTKDDDTVKGAKLYAENKASTAEANAKAYANTLVGDDSEIASRVEALEGKHVTGKTVAQEVNDGITALNLASTYAAKSLETTVSTHKADTIVHITAAERTKWNAGATKADSNETKIATINGDELTDGSIKKAVADAKSTLETKISDVETKVTANTTEIASVKTTAEAAKTKAETNEAALTKLNGNASTTGSVAKAVADAKFDLIDGASSGYQTLKELETKVKAAQNSADTANNAIGTDTTSGTVKYRIKTNETNISALTTRVTNAENDIDTLQGQISGVFHFKGSATKNGSELYVTVNGQTVQVVNQQIGDVYTVGDEEYAWDGTTWIMLGVTTDLSNYYTKSDVDGKIGGITGAFHFRGVATSFNNDGTPAYVIQDGKKYVSGIELSEGDVWLDSDGQQFAWNGSQWVKLGYMTDLSAYSTTSQVESMIEGKLTGLYTFKGEAANLNAIVGPSRGDVYIVDGVQYAWSGTEWTEISSNVDLSSYSTTAQVNELIKTAKTDVQNVAAVDASTKADAAKAAAINEVTTLKGDATKTVGAIEDEVDTLNALVTDTSTGLNKRVTDNTTAITNINDSKTGILAQAKSYTDTEVDKIDTRVKTLEDLKPAEKGAQVNKIENIQDAEGVNLTITNKAIKLPVATAAKAGLVKPGEEFTLGTDGKLDIKEININKLVQTDGDIIIFDCGTSIR